MNKYFELKKYLDVLTVDSWETTFDEIEEILGFRLPDSARKYPAWWSNSTGSQHSQSSSWQDVGWKTKNLNLSSETVCFFKTQSRDIVPVSEVSEIEPIGKPITIAEAKAGLSQKFGVSPDDIEIIIKG